MSECGGVLVIDATMIGGGKTGIEVYSEQLLIALAKMDFNERILVRILVSDSYCVPSDLNVFEVVRVKSNSKLALHAFWVPFYLLKYRPNIFFSPVFPPSYLAILLKMIFRFRLVRIVYDGVLWMYPETLSVKNKLYYKPLESIGLYFYDSILTISESSRRDLIALYPALKNKINNIGIGLAPANMKVSLSGGGKQYFLFVGTIDVRKNIEVALEAFSIFIKKSDSSVRFVVAGRSAWGSKRLHSKIEELGIGQSVDVLGYVDDVALDQLYRNALAFVFPSIYEGFGLPVVEAMQRQCLVAASKNSSIPEAAGGAAILVSDYWSSIAWSEVFSRIYLMSAEERQLIIKAGEFRAAKLPWSKVAKKASVVLDGLL